MADKAVSELVAAQQITATDLFVLEQNGTAKKLTGQVLLNWLTAAADGHGGIASIEKHSTRGLVDTYRITLADTTYFDFVVTNGRAITSVEKTGTDGLVDTYTITFNDGSDSIFTVTNGAKGDKGDNTYTWIKYAAQEPTEDSHSIGNLPDDWIGIYYGSLDTAPDDWTQYSWFKMKGEQGETGAPATLVSSSVAYQVGDSGSIIPSGVWSDTVAVVPQGKYLWTRIVTQFNTGAPITSYSVSRMGIDGAGSVSSVAGVSPDSDGNVPLTAENIEALPTAGGDMTGPINMNGQKITGLNAPTADDEAVNWESVKEWGKAKAGFIYPLAASVVPEGFLLCDGAAYSRTEYPELFAAIGTMYGSGDGSTTFNVPDITFADGVGAIIATGKGTGVSVSDIIMGAQAFPLGIPYGGTGAGDAKTARENLEITPENIGAARPPELLWENASPESSFAAQTIALDLSSFDFVKIVFKRAYTNTPDIWTMCEVGRICTLQAVADNNSGIWSCVRTATVSKDGIQFSAGTIASFETAAFTRTATNFTIPLIIYGIKGVSA